MFITWRWWRCLSCGRWAILFLSVDFIEILWWFDLILYWVNISLDFSVTNFWLNWFDFILISLWLVLLGMFNWLNSLYLDWLSLTLFWLDWFDNCWFNYLIWYHIWTHILIWFNTCHHYMYWERMWSLKFF